MTMRVDWSLGNVVCVQIPRIQEREYAQLFKRAALGTGLPLVFQANNGRVEWDLSWDEMCIEILEDSKVVRIRLPADQFVSLGEAIEEHIFKNSEYELDHSFETLGAEISPSHFRDVVFETYKDEL